MTLLGMPLDDEEEMEDLEATSKMKDKIV